jgi:hypothetical protein
MTADDYLADYAELGLEPGCSLHALERAWRLAVSELHPDRGAPGDSALRSARLREVSVSYQRLRQFEREHGRLPGEAVQTPPPAFVPVFADEGAQSGYAPSPAADPGSRPAAASRLWLWPAFVLVGLGLTGVDWNSNTDPTSPATRSQHPVPAAATAGLAAEMDEPGTAVPRRIRIGTDEAQVEHLMGTPITISRDIWEYGPSHVRFERGRVVGWYSSPLKPLPVDQNQR